MSATPASKTPRTDAIEWYRNQSEVRGRHGRQIRYILRHASAGRSEELRAMDESQAEHDERQSAEFGRWADAIEKLELENTALLSALEAQEEADAAEKEASFVFEEHHGDRTPEQEEQCKQAAQVAIAKILRAKALRTAALAKL